MPGIHRADETALPTNPRQTGDVPVTHNAHWRHFRVHSESGNTKRITLFIPFYISREHGRGRVSNFDVRQIQIVYNTL